MIPDKDHTTDTRKSQLMHDTIELCIEEVIEKMFGKVRDDVKNPYQMYNLVNNYPALLLVAMYIDYGCSLDNLASELLIADIRNRHGGKHPRIGKLYMQYKEIYKSFFVRGAMLRHYRRVADERLHERIANIK